MEQNQITQQELEQVRYVASVMASIETELSQLSMNKFHIEEEISSRYKKWRTMAEQMQSAKDAMYKKYGDIDLDIKTGSYVVRQKENI
jgi:hypothetical protein